MPFGHMELKEWDPADHPRDIRNGRFTERRFGFLRLDPTANAMHFTKKRGLHKRPNADATRFDGIPAKHRAKMYAAFREKTPITGTDAKTYPDLVRNVRALWDAAPPQTRAEGSTWYRKAKVAAQDIAANHGVHEDIAIAVVAALSPQQEWSGNVAFADFVVKVLTEDRVFDPSEGAIDALLNPEPIRVKGGWKTPAPVDVRPWVGKRLSELENDSRGKVLGRAINTLMGDEGVKADFPGHELPLKSGDDFRLVSASGGFTPIAKAADIVRGKDLDEVLNGHKVRSFFNNISDPDNLLGHGDVTVDTHATMAALDVLHLPSGDPKVKARQKMQKEKSAALVGGPPSSADLNMSGLYAMFASAYRDVADDLGVPPNHVQAAVWIQWRNMKGLA